MGVLPLRTSSNVPGLRVLMEGKPAAESRDLALDEMEEVLLGCKITHLENTMFVMCEPSFPSQGYLG